MNRIKSLKVDVVRMYSSNNAQRRSEGQSEIYEIRNLVAKSE